METKGSGLHSNEPATRSYPEPYKSNQHSHTIITEVHFSITLPSTPAILQWSLSFTFATKLLPTPHYTILPSFITLNLLKIFNFLQPHYFLSPTLKYTIFSSFMLLRLSYTQTDNFFQPCALSLS